MSSDACPYSHLIVAPEQPTDAIPWASRMRLADGLVVSQRLVGNGHPRELFTQLGVAERLFEARQRAPVVQLTLELLKAEDAEDGEEQPEEQCDVAELGQSRQDCADEGGHARQPLERAQRAQRAQRTQGRVVAERGEEDRGPRKAHHRKVELAPRVA